MKTITLNKAILEWPVEDDGIDRGEPEHRSYEIWRHAEQLLLHPAKRDTVADAIINLNRAIQVRIKNIASIYQLRKIPLRSYRADILSFLADTSIVRPKLVKQVRSIRNRIEHEDAVPPSQKQCAELLEFTWYFLKATDAILRNIPDNVVYSKADQGWWVKFELDYSTWKLSAGGVLPPTMLSSGLLENGIILQEFSEQEVADLRSRTPSYPDILICIVGDAPNNGKVVNGTVLYESSLLMELASSIFGLA